MMVLSTRGVMFERLIVIVGKTGGKEIDMALPKDFIDTNDFTKEQILTIEDLGLAMKSVLLFDGCNYRSLLFSNPLFRGLFHF